MEINNVYGHPAYRGVVKKLKAELVKLRRELEAEGKILIEYRDNEWAQQLIQSAIARVNWQELADYLLEDGTPIEDWPKYTWGVVVKVSDGDTIKVGDKITMADDEVVIVSLPASNFYVPMNKCKGARVKELNNE